MSEELTHNRNNEVTVGIHRDGDAVVKTLGPPRGAAAPGWEASDDPRHWNYWRREALVYETGLPARLGLTAPALLSERSTDDGFVELTLEHVDGRTGHALTVDDVVATAGALGASQGRGAVIEHEWLSRRFLREYVASKSADLDSLMDDGFAAWSHPLVRDACPPGFKTAARALATSSVALVDLAERLAPRAVCHLDVWPNNLIRRAGGEVVFVDWSFVGDGALGEDVGNLVPDSVFDLFLPSTCLAELDERTFAAFVAGLRDAGWRGDDRVVRAGVCASAAKYCWLPPGMLAAAEREQLDYGGDRPVDAARRYAERGATTVFLAGWAHEALDLAERLGL